MDSVWTINMPKRRWVRIYGQILQHLQTYQHSNVITMDETWVYFDNPPTSLWQDSELPRPHRIRHHLGSKKAMISVFCTNSRILLVELLPAGETFNKTYFISLIEKLMDKIMQMMPRSGNTSMFIHMVNARPHLISEKQDEIGFK